MPKVYTLVHTSHFPELDSWIVFLPNLQSQQHQQCAATPSTATADPSLNFHAAVGVLVLGVAAAAVFWKVEPE